MKRYLSALSAILILAAASAYAQTNVTPADAVKYIGDTVTVTGLAETVIKTPNGNYFIVMGGEYPYNDFSAVVYKADAENFKDIKKYGGKKLSITGTVTIYNGTAEIILKHENQIKIADTDSK